MAVAVDACVLVTRRQAVSRSCCRAPQPGLAGIIDANARFTLRAAPAPGRAARAAPHIGAQQRRAHALPAFLLKNSNT